MIQFYSISEKETIKKEVLDDKDGAVVSIKDFSLCDTVNHIYERINIPFKDDNLDGFYDAFINVSYYNERRVSIFHNRIGRNLNADLSHYLQVLKSANIYKKACDKGGYANLILWFDIEDKSLLDSIKGGYLYYEKGRWHMLCSLPTIIDSLIMNDIVQCFMTIKHIVIDGIVYKSNEIEEAGVSSFGKISFCGKMDVVSGWTTMDMEYGTNSLVITLSGSKIELRTKANKVYDYLCMSLKLIYEQLRPSRQCEYIIFYQIGI